MDETLTALYAQAEEQALKIYALEKSIRDQTYTGPLQVVLNDLSDAHYKNYALYDQIYSYISEPEKKSFWKKLFRK